ncbi:DUF4153 domain-containing protein [Sphingomonas sp. IC081]|uniref:DUF4153 domain-containing protein n=1 Tax=Sphingomonas sp. IC081 TaxID=304378 RepID=UPI0011586800|nr:DUF4173 domain-containing protein [Sphingomonas sp. IC081]QDK34818.1 DUF4173 domain-containing protein [Sphingomonas sp. IC081]
MHFAAAPLGASFRWKLGLGLAVVAVGDWLLYQRGLAYGSWGLLALALLAALLAGTPALRRSKPGLPAALAACLFALALTWDPGPLAWTLFWLAAGMAALLARTGRFDDGWRWAQRLFWQALRAPFAPLLDMRRIAKVRAAGHGRRIGLRRAASLLTMPLLGGAVIVALFCAANPILAGAVSSLLSIDTSLVAQGGRAILWTIVFAMAWSLLRPGLLRHPLPLFEGRGELRLPGFSPASITLSLVVFNAIFAVQNLLDAAYLWGMAALPPGMTLADYAHRGAYPLIATALLAALFVLIALRPGSETAGSPAIRRLVTLWIMQNIVLVASSIQRTADYIEAYSLTRLRIAALAWMVLVAFGLATICWRLLRNRSSAWLVNVNLAATALVLTGFCFVDLGTMAARWNVRHAREVGGRGAALDLCYLNRMGGSALLPLLELEQRRGLNPGFHARVQAVRLDAQQRQPVALGLIDMRRQEQARTIAATLPRPDLGGGLRDCDGAVITELPAEPPSPVPAPAPAPASAPTPSPAPPAQSPTQPAAPR